MKTTSLKNTFVSAAFIILMSLLVLSSCKKDNSEPLQEPSPIPEANLDIPVCHPIITEGCDPMNHIIDTMDFPYIDISQLIGSAKSSASEGGSFWADAGMWILEKGGGGLVAGMFSPLGSMLTNAILGGDETQQKLDKIIGELKVIENQMNILMSNTELALQVLDEVNYNQIHQNYTEFQSILTSLTNVNDIYTRRLEAIHENSMNLDPDEMEQQIVQVMQEWGNQQIPYCGNAYNALNQLSNRLYSSLIFHGSQRNIFDIYDVIVFHNTPWEMTGYDIRDMFRAAVATEVLRSAWLSALYYRTINADDKVLEVGTTINTLNAFFSHDGNTVNRRYDKVVCQLSGALFILQSDALTWHKSWTCTTNISGLNGQKHAFLDGIVSDADNVNVAHDSQLTNAQISQITTYYRTSFGKDYTILNCLQDGGMIVPGHYNTIFTLQNAYSNEVANYEDVYLMSQETTMDIYVDNWFWLAEIFGESIFRTSGFYNVGLPLNGYIIVDGNQCHGYEPCFYHDEHFSSTISIKATSAEMAWIPLRYHLTKWVAESDYEFVFPGKYFLWFKPGSLQTYTQYDI